MRLAFGDCVFDRQTRELSRRGSLVHVPPKTFRLLEVLLEKRPAAVTKESLMEALWPGVFVADGNLARLVAELRDTIGDDAQMPRFVRTVARFGYAFHGDVTAKDDRSPGPPSPPAVFLLLWGDREIALSEGENVLGRDASAGIRVDDASVSRHHAHIVISGYLARIEDLGSKNGTHVDGRRVESPTSLRDGSEILLGSVSLVFRRLEPGPSTATVASR